MGETTHHIKDKGVDGIWSYTHQGEIIKVGIQLKGYSDFAANKEKSFRRTTLAQVQESRQIILSKLLLCLCADLNSISHREKSRNLQLDTSQDDYVQVISPEKMAGVWKWFTGANIEKLKQIQEAGYACLSVVFDSLGNRNQNSFGKNSRGDWSHPKTTTARVGQQVDINAIANSPDAVNLEFQFALQRSGQSFEIRQGWSKNPYWNWKVVQDDIGRQVIIKIAARRKKDYYQFADSDDYTYAIFEVIP